MAEDRNESSICATLLRESVTGRDHSILTKALAYAIVAIQRLPDHRQEWSDCEDMKRLLAHLCAEDYLCPEDLQHQLAGFGLNLDLSVDEWWRSHLLNNAKGHLTGIWPPVVNRDGTVLRQGSVNPSATIIDFPT
jgi:hypothetical protein